MIVISKPRISAFQRVYYLYKFPYVLIIITLIIISFIIVIIIMKKLIIVFSIGLVHIGKLQKLLQQSFGPCVFQILARIIDNAKDT